VSNVSINADIEMVKLVLPEIRSAKRDF